MYILDDGRFWAELGADWLKVRHLRRTLKEVNGPLSVMEFTLNMTLDTTTHAPQGWAFVRALGRGAFGEVRMIVNKRTEEPC